VVSVVPKTVAITVKLPVIFTPKNAVRQMKFGAAKTVCDSRTRNLTPRRKGAKAQRKTETALRLGVFAPLR
jgi:hypothetical protein